MSANGYRFYDLLSELGPNDHPNWLELFDKWCGRTHRQVGWTLTDLVQSGRGTGWEAVVSIDGAMIPGIVGRGDNKTEAKINAVQQIQDRRNILTIRNPGN
ncbi:hypothetical protein BDV93DRAFT_110066 [Ceratobasidium sp. AG-I]|nr:hypothetical protein BDV93DRAFT_110066 [Ceratobasidium sp. AG-I]